MKLVYNADDLNQKEELKSEPKQVVDFETMETEELVAQIRYLSERIKRLEIDLAWSNKVSSQ